MNIIRRKADMPPPAGSRAFVPTMGALHAGHMSLIDLAHEVAEEVVVSVFVNPKQFGPEEDLARYPRQEPIDIELCRAAGVDVFYAPSVADVYPLGLGAITIKVGLVGDHWEGHYRPGHFDGVATVVGKLCHVVQPTHLILGQKDLQQCAVIARFIQAMDEPYRLVIAPTLRAEDGLALSSRNAYLSPSQRIIAPKLYRVLAHTQAELLAGTAASEALADARAALAEDFNVQYLALVDRNTLQELSGPTPDAALIVAAFLGTTRLIDNVLLF
jgi:pantoate--beta-alanine ligase